MIIKVNSSALRYGAMIGYKLARLEWIWGSPFEFAIKEFEPSKNELLAELPTDKTTFDETNYQTFSQSILAYFLRSDIETYASILIGISIQRAGLIGASSDSDKNEELNKLAKSSLVSIPQRLIPNKDAFFDFLFKHKDMELFSLFDLLDQYCSNNLGGPEENLASPNYISESKRKPTIFLSFCQKDECIANLIEDQLRFLTNDGIDFSRYNRVPYKGSFRQFMNSIPDHDFVLSIVSDSYLKSQACMYEVGETVKDHNFEKKLLFIVLNENDQKYYSSDNNNPVAARIYGSETERLAYTLYWKKKYIKLEEQIKEIDDIEATSNAANELREIGQIYRKDINVFLEYLSKNRGKGFDELFACRFSDILQLIFPGWESKLFANCKTIPELLTTALMEIWKTTQTDYNQIALGSKISSHQTGLVVLADNISPSKQRYRLVAMDGLMGNTFATGNIINASNTNQDPRYFNAVGFTQSELVIPIKINGNVVGVINSESEETDHYSESIQTRLLTIANALSLSLSRLGYIANMSQINIPYVHIEFN